MERLCYYGLDHLAGRLVIDLRSAVMEGEAAEEELDAECDTYCITVRQIHSLETDRTGRRG